MAARPPARQADEKPWSAVPPDRPPSPSRVAPHPRTPPPEAARNRTAHEPVSAFLAALPRRVPRGTDAAAVQHLDPAARARERRTTAIGCSRRTASCCSGSRSASSPGSPNSPPPPRATRCRSRSPCADAPARGAGPARPARRRPRQPAADSRRRRPPAHEQTSLNPGVHLRDVRRRQGEPARARRRACRSPSIRRPTTRCSSTAASASARRT